MPMKTNPIMTNVVKEMLTDEPGPFYSYILFLIEELERKNKKLEKRLMSWETYDQNDVAYVVAFGPESYQDKHGDEHPRWHLSRCDANEDEILVTTYFTFDAIVEAGENLSQMLNIPFENEASPA